MIETSQGKLNKLKKILVCPKCKSFKLNLDHPSIFCDTCGIVYEKYQDMPLLIRPDSDVLNWYQPRKTSALKPPTAKNKLRRFVESKLPPERIWTQKSQRTIQKMLAEKNPDHPDSTVVLIGAGYEPVYRKACHPYQDIIRAGLAQRGDADLTCELCDLPIEENALDLVFSSSVLEHVYNPERAVEEMYRVLKPGGYVYAEIPFMRAFHMIPVDYQRYTISGIEALFTRHGFTLLEKGICSGPFTSLALFIQDFAGGLFSFNRYLGLLIGLFLILSLHPIKYLDRACEDTHWAKTTACNFYFLGKKDIEGPPA
jgi:SAM-dependent methyltransferase